MKSRINSLTETTGFIVPHNSWAGGAGAVGFWVEHADAIAPTRRPVAMAAPTKATDFMWPECTAGAAGNENGAARRTVDVIPIGNLLTRLEEFPTGGTRRRARCWRVAFTQWLRVPPTCPHCGAAGRVKLECTVRGFVAELKWCCSSCAYQWPVICGLTKPRGSRRAA